MPTAPSNVKKGIVLFINIIICLGACCSKEFEDTKRVIRIRKEQTTQSPKEKVQKDKQRSAKHTHKTKDRVTRISLKTRGELKCSRRVIVPVPLVALVMLI